MCRKKVYPNHCWSGGGDRWRQKFSFFSEFTDLSVKLVPGPLVVPGPQLRIPN